MHTLEEDVRKLIKLKEAGRFISVSKQSPLIKSFAKIEFDHNGHVDLHTVDTVIRSLIHTLKKNGQIT
ncbi:hypothetical protein ACE1TH_16350 [Shouchella sp. JSM 1781072]|uniref:hypothetical protein n=1 Tax=Bacillaceae TaxID=186817 RepID=UPI000C0807ED|nr:MULTISPECIES: hypothetical protein [Bacillaceae]UTR06171.1 hypothetical protein MM326_19180 [Alkalihalobacillus sp. LMS6]